MNIYKLLGSLLLIIALTGCTENLVELGENTYSPKIVVEGYLFANQKVENIKVTRNFPLNSSIQVSSIVLSSADVSIKELESGKDFKLTFNTQKFTFEYAGNDLFIDYGKEYQLNVSAIVDGKRLYASSITKVPQKGFKINRELSQFDPIFYREPDAMGTPKSFVLNFTPSPGTKFYLISLLALDASDKTFVYDNPYFEIKKEDLNKELDRFRLQANQLPNINSFGGNIEYEIPWLDLWFYGNHRLILYAVDENYRLYFQTYGSVQEFDGNFHEPRFNFIGEGIGVFGSAIADTVYLTVKK
jgi:hypothetical protein